MDALLLSFFLVLFLFGLLFGSFSSVLISRWHSGQSGILAGRSECPYCHHTLSARELIPLFSYLIQGGKCLNCKTKIPAFYPLLELFMGLVFVVAGVTMLFLRVPVFSLAGVILLIYFFVTAIYIAYDLRYMEIPDQALIPAIWLALGTLGILWIDPTLVAPLFPSLLIHGISTDTILSVTLSSFLGAWIIYTFFYLQILIPGVIHAVKHKKRGVIRDLLLSYFTFPLELLFPRLVSFHYSADPEEEVPSWIGGGDLRIAFFIGLTLGWASTLTTLLFAYVIGAVVGVIYIIVTRKRGQQIPFGPFLGFAWMVSLLLSLPIEILLQI